MVVTEQWMKEMFGKLNALYFSSKLPVPVLGVSHSRTQLGTMGFRKNRFWGMTRFSDFTIRLTTYYDMTERQACNVLLHEMIHYYIAYHRQRDTSPHGRIFRTMMEQLNRDYGWEIRISTSTKGWKVSEAVKARQRRRGAFCVLALRMAEGQCFLSRVSPGFVRRIDAQLRHLPEVGSYGWYTTTLEEFAVYPQVRSLRGRKVSEEVFTKLVSQMKALDTRGVGHS